MGAKNYFFLQAIEFMVTGELRVPVVDDAFSNRWERTLGLCSEFLEMVDLYDLDADGASYLRNTVERTMCGIVARHMTVRLC
jgi:hypothetical protein